MGMRWKFRIFICYLHVNKGSSYSNIHTYCLARMY